ncbi:MAG: DNA modification methylase [Deltaproteobacteria bacterium]|nr:DNA modification methylase [Deltaproteobacteria bacterium]
MKRNNKEIPIRCKGNRYLPFDKLKTFQGALKEMSEANAGKLKASILKYGWVAPVFVWNKNEILDGHGRLLVLGELLKEGYAIDALPVVDIEAQTKKEAAEILLAINSKYQTITDEGLYQFMNEMDLKIDDLSIFELPDIDFKEFEAEFFSEDNEGIEKEEIPDVPVVPKTKKGDLYILGRHRLLCGNSTDMMDVERLMDGKKANLVITSPPYFNQREYSFWESYEAFLKDMEKVILNIKKIVKEPYAVCWNTGDSVTDRLDIPADESALFTKAGFLYRDKMAWIKAGAVLSIPRNGHIGNGRYFPALAWEPILVFTGEKHPEFELSDISEVNGFFKNVWEINQVVGSEQKKIGHTALFPVELARRCFLAYSKKGAICYEPFYGGGTTLIAAEKTGRVCYGMELDPGYCDVIVSRYVNLTGGAVVLNGKKVNWKTDG